MTPAERAVAWWRAYAAWEQSGPPGARDDQLHPGDLRPPAGTTWGPTEWGQAADALRAIWHHPTAYKSPYLLMVIATASTEATPPPETGSDAWVALPGAPRWGWWVAAGLGGAVVLGLLWAAGRRPSRA